LADGHDPRTVTVLAGRKPVGAKAARRDDHRVLITLDTAVTIEAGETLSVTAS
jgi:hypothetical protein